MKQHLSKSYANPVLPSPAYIMCPTVSIRLQNIVSNWQDCHPMTDSYIRYVQSREKVLARGCEKFLPALA